MQVGQGSANHKDLIFTNFIFYIQYIQIND